MLPTAQILGHSESLYPLDSHMISLIIFSCILDVTQMSLSLTACEYKRSHVNDNTWLH